MKLFLSAILLVSFLSCSKSDLQNDAAATKSLGCTNTIKATVQKAMLNMDGTEYFYYLSVDGNISGSSSVVPDALPSYLQEEGKHLNIKYSTTAQKYTYVVCLAGHTMDPSNPDYLTLPLVQVCNATAIN